MRVIIAGGRHFLDYGFLEKKCNKLIPVGKHEIVTGGATGADALGAKYANENGYGLKTFPAKWGKYGKSAGPIRNNIMANYADALIAFWDGKSKGTENMINTAKRKGVNCRVIYYE